MPWNHDPRYTLGVVKSGAASAHGHIAQVGCDRASLGVPLVKFPSSSSAPVVPYTSWKQHSYRSWCRYCDQHRRFDRLNRVTNAIQTRCGSLIPSLLPHCCWLLLFLFECKNVPHLHSRQSPIHNIFAPASIEIFPLIS